MKAKNPSILEGLIIKISDLGCCCLVLRRGFVIDN
jgi:hypothetical protein